MDLLNLQVLTSPVAGLAIVVICLVWLATYFKQWLDRSEAKATERESTSAEREKEWLKRFEKQQKDCEAENQRLHGEIKECKKSHDLEYKNMQAQFAELMQQVGFLRGLHEGFKINNTGELKQHLIPEQKKE